MSWRTVHRALLVLIAAGTVVTGAIQVMAPAFVLGVVRAEASPASRHFFGIVGMFMVLFGSQLLHALAFAATAQPVAVLWAALQKLGAAAAVALGALHAVFGSGLAWAIAGFDLLSGVLAMAWWVRMRTEGQR